MAGAARPARRLLFVGYLVSSVQTTGVRTGSDIVRFWNLRSRKRERGASLYPPFSAASCAPGRVPARRCLGGRVPSWHAYRRGAVNRPTVTRRTRCSSTSRDPPP